MAVVEVPHGGNQPDGATSRPLGIERFAEAFPPVEDG